MLVLVLYFLISMIPAALLLLWLLKQKNMPEDYTENCKNSFKAGLFSTLLVIAMSGTLVVLGLLVRFRNDYPIAWQAYYKFIAIAFAEELCKYLAFRHVVKEHNYSWLEYTIYMVFVGTGFEVLESIVYAFTTNPIQMLVRGVTMMHAAFAYVMGYYYGKSQYTGKKGWFILGFFISWMLHGWYDFTLSDELIALNDNWVFVPVTIALASIVLIIAFIIFVRKRRNTEMYITREY